MISPQANQFTSVDQLSQHLVTIAAGAAQSVADMLVEGAAQATAGNLSIDKKSSFHDLVTRYDRESERAIVDYIFHHYPDSAVMGEEDGAKGSGSIHWYIDPIDGTSNFAAGIPFFCVSIGAAHNGQMIAGVIFDPIRRELFAATRQGAFLNGRPIRSHGGQRDSQSLLLTAFPSPHSGVSDEDFRRFSEMVKQFATVRRMGSAALALAYVACGRVDVAFEPAINPWDVAAGMLLVRQAGGQYLPFGPVDSPTHPQPWQYPSFIAACPEFELDKSVMRMFLAPAG